MAAARDSPPGCWAARLARPIASQCVLRGWLGGAQPADITLTMEVVTPATDTEAAPCGTGDEIVVDYIGYLEDGTEFQRATRCGDRPRGWKGVNRREGPSPAPAPARPPASPSPSASAR